MCENDSGREAGQTHVDHFGMLVARGFEADYEHWGRLDDWSLREGHLLMCGYDPNAIKDYWDSRAPSHPEEWCLGSLDSMFYSMYTHTIGDEVPNTFGIGSRMTELEELVNTAVSAGTLPLLGRREGMDYELRIKPTHYISFCKSKGFPIPSPLEALQDGTEEDRFVSFGAPLPSTGSFYDYWQLLDEWSIWDGVLLLKGLDPNSISEWWRHREPDYPDDYEEFSVAEMLEVMQREQHSAGGPEPILFDSGVISSLKKLEELLTRAIRSKALEVRGDANDHVSWLMVHPWTFLQYCAKKGIEIPAPLKQVMTRDPEVSGAVDEGSQVASGEGSKDVEESAPRSGVGTVARNTKNENHPRSRDRKERLAALERCVIAAIQRDPDSCRGRGRRYSAAQIYEHMRYSGESELWPPGFGMPENGGRWKRDITEILKKYNYFKD